MMLNILHLDKNHPHLLQALNDFGHTNDCDFLSAKEIIEAKIHLYDGIIIRSRIPLDKEFLQKATNLKFIARVGAGLENIDLEFATTKNIQLFNAPEGNRDAVAEHAVGMLLTLMNRIVITNQEVRKGLWLREQNRGDELCGKVVGIIGYGNMGKAFCKRLKGFDVDVIFYDILPNIGDENAKQVTLEAIFDQTDVLSLHTPYTAETNQMVDVDFLAKFKKNIYLINTARGKSVVTSAVVNGLKSGKIIGACLDVLEYEKASFEHFFENEINPDLEYLINSEKVILTPHIAGWSHQSNYKLADVIVQKIINWHKKIK